MKITYIPQPSVRSYKTGKWHLESCSMMHRMRAVAYHMPSTWEWQWCIPPEEMRADGWDAVKPIGIQIDSLPWMDDVHANRWTFPVREFQEKIKDFQPDIVYAECVEHVASIKYVLISLGYDKTKIIAQIGYVPMHTGGKHEVQPNPMIRQMEGADIADLVTFNSEIELSTWRSHAYKEYDYVLEDKKIKVFNSLFDPDDVKCYREAGRSLRATEFSGKDGIPRIFYTGRLSDQKRTNYASLIQALDMLKKDYAFKVWVGNPNEAVSVDIANNTFPNTEVIHTGATLSRSQYVQFLWAADVVPILIPNRTASFCEAVESENFVLCADKIGGGGDKGIWRIEDADSETIAATLGGMFDTWAEMFDSDVQRLYRKQERWVTKEHAVHRNIEEIREMFEKC